MTDVPFKPGNTAEITCKIENFTVELTANPFFVLTNIKNFYSSAVYLDNSIISSNLYKILLVMVEVDAHDIGFLFVNDALNLCDLFGWVKDMAIFAVKVYSSLASLTII